MTRPSRSTPVPPNFVGSFQATASGFFPPASQSGSARESPPGEPPLPAASGGQHPGIRGWSEWTRVRPPPGVSTEDRAKSRRRNTANMLALRGMRPDDLRARIELAKRDLDRAGVSGGLKGTKYSVLIRREMRQAGDAARLPVEVLRDIAGIRQTSALNIERKHGFVEADRLKRGKHVTHVDGPKLLEVIMETAVAGNGASLRPRVTPGSANPFAAAPRAGAGSPEEAGAWPAPVEEEAPEGWPHDLPFKRRVESLDHALARGPLAPGMLIEAAREGVTYRVGDTLRPEGPWQASDLVPLSR